MLLERRQYGNIPVPIQEVDAEYVFSTCIVCGVLLLLSWIAVSLRFYTRGFIIGALGKDDWVILATQVSNAVPKRPLLDVLTERQTFFTILCSGIIAVDVMVSNKKLLTGDLMTVSTNVRMLDHDRAATHCEQIFIMTEIFYLATISALKIAFAIFFLRLSKDKWQRIVIYVLVTVTTSIGFGYMWFVIFQCGVPGAQGIAFWIRRLGKHYYISCIRRHSCSNPMSI
jgi:hypothetical protein